MVDDNDIRKKPFYGYYKSKGLIKFLINNLDKLIIFFWKIFYFFSILKKARPTITCIEEKIWYKASPNDNPKFYIKNFYASFKFIKEDNLKISL